MTLGECQYGKLWDHVSDSEEMFHVYMQAAYNYKQCLVWASRGAQIDTCTMFSFRFVRAKHLKKV